MIKTKAKMQMTRATMQIIILNKAKLAISKKYIAILIVIIRFL